MSAVLERPNATRERAPATIVPVLIALIAFVLFLCLQTSQLLREHAGLATLRDNQAAPMAESAKVRTQLDALFAKTAELARNGNPRAKAIIDDAARQGVTVKPPG